jgi:hypothetical protein
LTFSSISFISHSKYLSPFHIFVVHFVPFLTCSRYELFVRTFHLQCLWHLLFGQIYKSYSNSSHKDLKNSLSVLSISHIRMDSVSNEVLTTHHNRIFKLMNQNSPIFVMIIQEQWLIFKMWKYQTMEQLSWFVDPHSFKKWWMKSLSNYSGLSKSMKTSFNRA